MTVLVTGGAGYVGSVMVRSLISVKAASQHIGVRA